MAYPRVSGPKRVNTHSSCGTDSLASWIIPGWNSVTTRLKTRCGRNNWIHVGSEQAGPRVAAIISIVETCRRLRIPVREYLSAVLPGLENFPANRVKELTPAAWFARK